MPWFSYGLWGFPSSSWAAFQQAGFGMCNLWPKCLATTSGLQSLGRVGKKWQTPQLGLQAPMLVDGELARFQFALLPPSETHPTWRSGQSAWQVPCCGRLPVPPVLPMLHSPLLTLGGSFFAASCVADLLRGFSTKVAAPRSNMMTDVRDCQSHLGLKTLGSSAEDQF